MKNSEKIIVDTDEPVRLDRYIRRHFETATQGVIEKALRNGQIRLNGLKSKTSDRVVDNDEITYFVGLFEKEVASQAKSFSKSAIILAKQLLSEYLLFSSDEFFAIDKPAGLAVQGGSKIMLSIDEALGYLNQTEGCAYKLVHRLDKETSGVLLIANGYSNAAKLGNAFKENLIEKTYIAVTSGVPNDPHGSLVHNIGKDRSEIFEVVKELKEGGKKAETDYKVLAHAHRRSIIEFKPKTGRVHQLRFHAQFLGCPIIGDEKYGGEKATRMLLHAKELVIAKSVFGRVTKIKSELPYEFEL
jgi:23S rRNA pseudouridine955/2504/2580 synthase